MIAEDLPLDQAIQLHRAIRASISADQHAMWGKIIPALLSPPAVFLRITSSLEKLKLLMWCGLIHCEQGFLLLVIHWVYTDVHSNVLYKSKPNDHPGTSGSSVWPRLGLEYFLYFPFPASTLHQSIAHLFHKASPINAFIIHSLIKFDICLMGTNRHWE